MQLQIVSSTNHLIHATVTMGNIIWELACIYGQPNRRLQKDFWEIYTQRLSNIHNPLDCIRDFNDLLHCKDKYGGTQVTSNHTYNLTRFTNKLGLFDLGYIGSAFTWTNR